MSIANSPLVKTAIAGEDANWGRIVMAVGKAGEPADRDRLAIWFGGGRVAGGGGREPAYHEGQSSGGGEAAGNKIPRGFGSWGGGGGGWDRRPTKGLSGDKGGLPLV